MTLTGYMTNIILWLWQLPQHLLGLLLILVTRAKYTHTIKHGGISVWVYRVGDVRWGISLGRYVILGSGYSEVTEYHELGHSWYSRAMGPLYLPVVGFLSAVVANLIGSRILGRGYVWYYTRWVEAAADRRGGVVWHEGRRVLARWIANGVLRIPRGCCPATERETA